MPLPRGFEELAGRPGAVGVRVGGPIRWLLLGLGVLGILGGVPLFFVQAKESAQTETLWPVGAIFAALGIFCLVIYFLTTRTPKVVFDDTGVHSRALIGRASVHWSKIERVQPVRGGVWVTAPGGIYTASGKLTRKKTVRFNAQGLRSGAGPFVSYLHARLKNGGREPGS